jgi:hypothetical protein
MVWSALSFICRLGGGVPSRISKMHKDSTIVPPPGRAWFGRLMLAGALLCGGVPAYAQQFSASLVIAKGDGGPAVPAGKLRVAGLKERIETPDAANGFFLIDGAKPVAYFVRPASRVFMDARKSSQLTRLFVPVDPDRPCRQWQAMAKLTGAVDELDWRCERIGEQTIDAHSALGYRAISAHGPEFTGWIDVVHRFPIRIEAEDGSVLSVNDIRDEPQPAEPFEIPAGFRRFDPQMLIEQIKHSDVWVEKPPAQP